MPLWPVKKSLPLMVKIFSYLLLEDIFSYLGTHLLCEFLHCEFFSSFGIYFFCKVFVVVVVVMVATIKHHDQKDLGRKVFILS